MCFSHWRLQTGKESQKWLLSKIDQVWHASDLWLSLRWRALADHRRMGFRIAAKYHQYHWVSSCVGSEHHCQSPENHICDFTFRGIWQIVRIGGSSATHDGVVIISAHQDRYLPSHVSKILSSFSLSVNMWPWLPAPGDIRSFNRLNLFWLVISGADDDGSGSVTILEAYRALIAADFRPVRPIEFHWYSAEVRLIIRISDRTHAIYRKEGFLDRRL
jgi:hypothetical protein